MKLIANGINNEYILNVLPPHEVEVEEVLAAIAYGDLSGGERLLNTCLENKYQLKIWMRYDHTVPVNPRFLEKMLNHLKDGIYCQLIPDALHSKVLWFKGHGAYIGSANLTDRAWHTNIEAGVFLTEEDLYSSGMYEQLEEFFRNLENLEQSFSLTKEIIKEQRSLNSKRHRELNALDNDLETKRSQPKWGGLSFIDAKSAVDKRKESFGREWSAAIEYMRYIESHINDFRPNWIDIETPTFWQVDQFLHAYYYNQVREGSSYPFEQMHYCYKANPQARLMEMLRWWQALKTPPSDENINLEVNAVLIRQSLARSKIRSLDKHDLGGVLSATHATRNHYSKLSPSALGSTNNKSLTMAERLPLFTEKMSNMTNKKGQSIPELLYYVLYSGKPENLWERIYEAATNPELKIEHYGIYSIAEVAGWAMPEHTPPRNGRTNKALRALGYPVQVDM
ncbi:phospholipase D-like domain-containing protein [Vibrio sp. Sgm 22]|uniref:phospholipase D-like domain-containing protein n=1 Tax=unclassified Vibrio TaxID=2614977 RepID=UPI00224908F1|nr:phospholipase D-like domain-containing protein [Vibrio sp. 14G-20]MCX2774432.1 phospholipase D-like domain-containing protein [Vibrio sp. Sgm 22]